MKKFTKLTKKLLLSAIALGLTVVTLTTTTFAWYTSSNKVNVLGGSGTASSTTSDSTLLIAKGDSTTFGKQVQLDAATDLVPVEYNSVSGQFEELDSDSASTGYYKFVLKFRTTKTWDAEAQEDVKVYLSALTLVNSGAAVGETNILGAGNGKTGCPTGATYSVDIVRSLDMLIENGAAKSFYHLDELATIGGGSPYVESADVTDYDALAYYKEVMGKTLEAPATPSFTDLDLGQEICSLKGDGAYVDVAITFTVFINGWDKYCFDALRGQAFTLTMDFSTEQ